MKKILHPHFFGLILAMIFCQFAHSAPYGPEGRLTSFTQPSGKSIQLRIHGDEYYARTETTDGYTVVFDSAQNAYFYARLSADGSQFESTGILAGQAAPAGIDKSLEISGKSIQAIRASRRTQADIDRADRWKQRVEAKQVLEAAKGGARLSTQEAVQAGVKAAPLVGNVIGLTLLVEFQDVRFPADVAKMERVLNQDNYIEDGNSGSVKDYFFDQSGGQLTYTQVVPAVIKLSKVRAEYNKGDAGTAGRRLITEALEILRNRGFDTSELTVNGANNILATNVFFAGPDSGIWAQGLWPHQWTLAAPFNLGGGKFNFAYQITNLVDNKPVIGTFCHENGHLITDYPDLYDYGGESEGVGEHCLMGSGNHLNDEKTPAPINLYFKEMVGWANIIDINITSARPTWIPTTGNVGYRLRNPVDSREFFLVENRGDGDKWAEYAVDEGIMIWHIDDNVVGNDNEQRTPSQHYQVSLEQADGRFNLENGINRGDNLDLFDLLRPQFNSTTVPNSKWWSGAESGVSITTKSMPGSVVRVDFGNVETDKITVYNPNGGEIWFYDDTRSIDWVAGIDDTVEIDLMRGDAVVMNIATGTLNDGEFSWVIPNTLTPASDYKIRVTGSLRSNISDTSDEVFEIKASRTLADAVDQPELEWSTTGDSLWFPQTIVTYDGEDAAQVGPLSDDTSGTIRSEFVGPCQVSFRWRTSSSFENDFLSVAVEGSPDIAVPEPISGGTEWQSASVELPEGTHTVAWTFERGSAPDSFSDKSAWLDEVIVTPRTPDMEVLDVFGALLAHNASTLGMGIATVQGDPLTQTITISNKGDAIMKGITLAVQDANKPGYSVSPTVLPDMAPGESAEATVTLDPQYGGTNTANLLINSNDPDENPYTIKLITQVTGPRLMVVNGTAIMQTGNSVRFGETFFGTPITRTFQIRNSGEAPLRSIRATSSSPAGATFTAGPMNAVVYPGHFATLTVTYLALSPGSHAGSITITSNDLDNSPFIINVSGSTVTAPGIAIQDVTATAPLEISDSLNFGAHPMGEAPKQVKVRIANKGSNVLKNIRLTKTGDYSSEFAVIGSVPNQLPPGGKADVVVAFSPKAAGYRFCEITVDSNDPLNPKRAVKLFGDARLMPTPALSLKTADGTTMPLDSASLRFGKTAVKGMKTSRKISLQNLGLIKVSDIEVFIKGPDAADFSVSGNSFTSLNVGSQSDLIVDFDPSSTGLKSANLYILSSDPAQPRIKVVLSGEGVTNKGPEISVLAEDKSLESGKSVIRMNNRGKKVIRVAIVNDGDTALEMIRLAVAGESANNFSISRSKIQNLAPGQSAEVEIRFTPGKQVLVNAILKIRSNDKNENPFSVTLLGTE